MKSGSIWWRQLSISIGLMDGIEQFLLDERSFVLQIPGRLPWRDVFDSLLRERFSALRADRTLSICTPPSGCDPGEYLLTRFCPPDFQAGYWPGQSYAAYLAASDTLPLHESFIWLRGLCEKRELDSWRRFVQEYTAACKALPQQAVFVLEYTGPAGEKKWQGLRYVVREYDCRIFCLEAAAGLPYQEWAQHYLAEVAAQIGNGDAELCAALLDRHENMLEEPVETALEALRSPHTDGSPPDAYSREAVESALWKAQIAVVFPEVEQFRVRFIGQHTAALMRFLPVRNSNDEEIQEPQDLEIGNLDYIVRNNGGICPPEEVRRLAMCRQIRNLLAHNRIVPFAQLKRLWQA